MCLFIIHKRKEKKDIKSRKIKENQIKILEFRAYNDMLLPSFPNK